MGNLLRANSSIAFGVKLSFYLLFLNLKNEKIDNNIIYCISMI